MSKTLVFLFKRYDLHSILFKENGLLDGSVLTYISKKEVVMPVDIIVIGFVFSKKFVI